MAKATKQTKKYASSGKLKQTIEKRRQFKQIKKKNEGRDAAKLRKERKGKERHADDDITDDDDEEDEGEVDLENEIDDLNEAPKGNKGKGWVTLAGEFQGELSADAYVSCAATAKQQQDWFQQG